MENIISSIKNIIVQVIEDYTGDSTAEVNNKISKYDLGDKITEVIKKDIGKFATIKKLKDPDAPKRAVTAYLAYYKENARKIKSEYGLSTAPDVSRKAGELWSGLSSKEKSKYQKIADKDKERYEDENKEYRRPSDEEIKQKIDTIKEEKKLKDPNAPKKPKSAYIFFSNNNRASVKEETGLTSLGDISKELGKRWKSMDAEEKKEYNDMENKDKDRYYNEMKKYKPPTVEELRELALEKPKRKTTRKTMSVIS